MKIDGACHCGAITFEAEIDPAMVSICHCSDCQALSGAPYRASVLAAPDKFRILSGTPSIYVKTAESGSRRVQAFCSTCGSPIYATDFENRSAPFNIRIGIVRQRDDLVPRLQIWARSRQSWAADLKALPKLDTQPAR